jgi:PAS domain S-box-containing protein
MKSVGMGVLFALVASLACAVFSHPAVPPVSYALAGPPPARVRQVLLLHSYHKGMTWTEDITAGVEEVLDLKSNEAELTVEYMDTKRLFDDVHYDNLRRLYAHKFPPNAFDVIITADDNALDFILRYRDELFPGVPVVFCGVNRYSEDRLQGQAGITGVVETTDHLKTINLALAMQPEAQHVYVIVDRTTTGLTLREQLDAVLSNLARPVDVTYLDDVTLAEMEARLRALSPTDDLVYLMTFHRDSAGRTFTSSEIMYLVYEASGAPIYATGKEYLGQGIVGGYLNWGYNQGRIAAELAIRVLNGESPDAIPVITQGASPAMFDYVEMQRWGIPLGALPVGARLINRPVSFIEQHKPLVIGVTVVFLTQAIAITLLTVSVNQRKRAQAALRASEEQYRLLVENQTDLIVKTDAEGHFEFVSATYCELFDRTEAELLGSSFLFTIPEEEHGAALVMIEALAEPPHTAYIEQQAHTQQGMRWLAWAAKAILDDDGDMVGVLGVGRDITERKRAEQEIQRQNRDLRLLNRVITTAASSVDAAHVLQVLCEELARAFDLPRAAAGLIDATDRGAGDAGLTCTIVAEYAANDRPTLIGQRFLAYGNPVTGHLLQHRIPMFLPDIPRDVRIDDEIRAPLLARGTFAMLVLPVIVRDRMVGLLSLEAAQARTFSEPEITLAESAVTTVGQALEVAELTQELKRYNDELERRVTRRTLELRAAMERAQAADRAKSQFVSNVSHELRTPLTNIKLYIDLIQRGREEKRAFYIETVGREAERLHHLIEDLLNISRLDLGRIDLKAQPVDLNELVVTLSTDRQRLFAQRDLDLSVATTSAPATLRVDPKLIEQILTNLLTNALNYTPAGGAVRMTTERRAEDGRDWFTVSVADTGPGIPLEEQSHLFKRFYRGRVGRNAQVAGTGLGLAICQELIQLHKGRITVDSVPGEGSTFTVWLPGENHADEVT